MKNTVLIMGLAISLMASAQSIDEANKALYYGKYKSASAAFASLLQQNPSDARALHGLVKTYLFGGELKKADSLLAAKSSLKDDPYYKIASGSLLLENKKPQEATALFNSAMDQTRAKDVGVMAAIAETNIAAPAGNANEAINILEKAIKRDKKNAGLYVLLGDAYRKLSNGGEAYKAYEAAIQLDNKNAEAYYKLGDIFLSQKNKELYLEYFHKAIAADPHYAPALYKLYTHYFYHDAAKAMHYYKNYTANADLSSQHEYDLADLLYLNKQYDEAIKKANVIITSFGEATQPRIYKLIGYSYAANKDTANAAVYMQQYFAKAPDSMIIPKDYSAMSAYYLYQKEDSLALAYLQKASTIEKDTAELVAYFKQLADLSAKQKNYAAQSHWLGKYYTTNKDVKNTDLFNWGIALYRAEDFVKADSVFGKYTEKYPAHGYGYYWQAKSKALQDEGMKEGLAVPVYRKLIEVAQGDTTDANYKKWLVDAYGYLAAYEANTEKDYEEAVDYFEKILEVDPANEDAKKYISILDKRISDKADK